MAIQLSAIKKGQALKAPKIVIYGVGGIGKTTFAAGAPNPVFIFTEEGQGTLDVARFEPRTDDPVMRSWEEILESCRVLYEEDHDFQTVVLDSIDFAETLLWQYTSQKHGQASIEDFDFGKGYLKAVDEARTLFQWFDALRNDRGMAIVLICHSETVRFEDPEAESYDRYDLRLHKRLTAHVDFWSDAVLFANWKAHVVKDKEAFNKERRRAVGLGERVLYTESRPAYRAKNRYGLPHEIPLSWAAFQEGVAASATPQSATQPATAGKE